MKLAPKEYRAIIRGDLCAFIEGAFYELNPNAKFFHNWHLEVIASALEECRQGKITRLIINEPPRSLKSHSASVAFPAFLLGHDQSAQIICASYGQDLANKHALDCRRLMASGWYRSLFSGTHLSSDRQAMREFTTTQSGFRFSTSVGAH